MSFQYLYTLFQTQDSIFCFKGIRISEESQNVSPPAKSFYKKIKYIKKKLDRRKYSPVAAHSKIKIKDRVKDTSNLISFYDDTF